MKRIHIVHGMMALALLVMSALPATAAPAAYQIVNYTIDGGGQLLTTGGARFQLSGAIGQADSSAVQGAGQYTLIGGFWGPYQPITTPGTEATKLFLPLVMR
jgi:hypothetical protein